MKKITVLVMAVLMLALTPFVASAGMVEGTIQGYQCVTEGKTCPVGKEDPMAAVERVFVVLTADNNYYFIPNVDRGVLARHINERVKITGNVSMKYNSIQATKIDAYEKGSWVETWNMKDQLQFQNDFGY